jgi:hypothetical protein
LHQPKKQIFHGFKKNPSSKIMNLSYSMTSLGSSDGLIQHEQPVVRFTQINGVFKRCHQDNFAIIKDKENPPLKKQMVSSNFDFVRLWPVDEEPGPHRGDPLTGILEDKFVDIEVEELQCSNDDPMFSGLIIDNNDVSLEDLSSLTVFNEHFDNLPQDDQPKPVSLQLDKKVFNNFRSKFRTTRSVLIRGE